MKCALIKKNCYLISVLLISNIQAIEYEDSGWLHQEKIAISLGSNCTIAMQLNMAQLRHKACIFDWCLSSVAAIIHCIDNDFKDFFNIENCQLVEPMSVLDTLYNITIKHDFPFQIEMGGSRPGIPSKDVVYEQYNQTYNKLMRRIERFRKLKMYQGKLYFIRWGNTTKKEAVALFKTLYKKFKKQDFTLIVIGSSKDYRNPWRFTQIKNFFIPNTDGYIGEPNLITHIFKEVGLL